MRQSAESFHHARCASLSLSLSLSLINAIQKENESTLSLTVQLLELLHASNDEAENLLGSSELELNLPCQTQQI